FCCFVFFFSSRRRHTRSLRDWSSDVCSSDLGRLSPGDSGDRADPSEVEDRLPNVVPMATGGLALAYLHRTSGQAGWELRLAPLEIEERRVGKECRSRWAP